MSGLLKILSAFFCLLALLLAGPVFAAEIRVDTHQAVIGTGGGFLIDVVVHSDEAINALEGQLVFPADKLVVTEIRTGKSVVNFWLEEPQLERPGVISFSGGTPGGFSGANNLIFSVGFQAKSAGVAPLVLDHVRALLNDGLGSQVALSIRNAAVAVRTEDDSTLAERLVDLEPPEDFVPVIESDPNIFAGKYFLVFTTQDKISGIADYRVREGRWGWYSSAKSPHLLRHQALDKNLFVKAIDKAGNVREMVVRAPNPAPWHREYLVLLVILLLVLLVIFRPFF